MIVVIIVVTIVLVIIVIEAAPGDAAGALVRLHVYDLDPFTARLPNTN